jgi:ABC-type Mn2+/Zn2+ transport system permease subunit
MSDLEIIKTILTDFPYALFGSILVGLICAYLGTYVVSKRVVFVGAVLTQVSVLGIAFSMLPFITMDHTVSALMFSLVSVVVFSKLLTSKTTPQDSILGIAYVFSIAARMLIIQKSPKAEVSEIENLLRGDILFVTPEQFHLMLVVFAVIMLIHFLFRKEFIFVSFDAETARAQGFRSRAWELFFYITVGLVISVATRMVGDIFVFAFLVIPAVAGILLARKVTSIFILSVIVGFLSPIIGLYLAFKFDFPAGPIDVVVAFIIVTIAWVVRTVRE